MKSTALFSCALMALSSTAFGAADFRITEAYVGVTGEDGTPDWIEVTNFGDMAGDTGTLWYDDESLDVSAGAQLTSFSLEPGESAVFLVTDDVTDTSAAEFTALWGSVPNLGEGRDGGGLSQNGDTAAILLGDGTVVDTLEFSGLPQSNNATIEDLTGLATPAQLALSVAGVNGAYESAPFFNDNIGVNDMLTLVGSPGVNVPEPAAAMLGFIAVAGLAAARRR